MAVTTIDTKLAPRRIGAWTLQVVVAAAFLAAAGAKLSAQPSMVQLFAQIGFGQWFRVVTGIVEVVGAVALLTPRLAPIGGLWLGATMFFGVLTHLFILHSNPLPAIVLGLLSLVIVYLRRNELSSLVRTVLGQS